MKIYEVPLSSAAESFEVPLAGVSYKFTVLWRDPEPGWVLDIATAAGDPLVRGIPLVTGANLLEQHQHLGIGGALHVQTDNDPDAVPTFENLGSTSRLYFVTP